MKGARPAVHMLAQMAVYLKVLMFFLMQAQKKKTFSHFVSAGDSSINRTQDSVMFVKCKITRPGASEAIWVQM